MPHDAATVYLAIAPAVLGYLRAEGAPEPEDLLGEVFLQVARDLRRFEGDEDHLRRWVFSIAHNRLVDDHRRRRVRPRLASAPVPDLADTRPGVSTLLTDEALLGALAALSPDQREVVTLRFVADLSLEAVAAVTGRSVGAVKSLQSRALTNLRRAVSTAA